MKSYKVEYNWIFPYYVFGALAFISMTVLLLQIRSMDDFHFAHPAVIASVHCLTLGWTSMLIFGAGHQLIPVILNQPLHSMKLLKLNFISAAIGIPFIIAGLFRFNFNFFTLAGAMLMTISAICFSLNVFLTAKVSKENHIQALFLKAASVWLIVTCILGVLQSINFNHFILPFDSFRLMNTHAHLGLIGFISTTIVGVSSKLLPMFTLSKYKNDKILKIIFILIHSGLVFYILSEFADKLYLLLSVLSFICAFACFIYYTLNVFKQRLRKKMEAPIKSTWAYQISLIPIVLLSLPYLTDTFDPNKLKFVYGNLWLLGAIGGMLTGMTFKTLPFMAWNTKKQSGSSILPKDLFNQGQYTMMSLMQVFGVVLFCAGILINSFWICKTALVLLLSSSLFYFYLILKIHSFTIKNGDQSSD